jgi:hypothetical protein
VSRQIHAETATLPYVLNTISFYNALATNGFTKNRTAEQSRAVQSIRLQVSDGIRQLSFPAEWAQCHLSKPSKFWSLKNIEISGNEVVLDLDYVEARMTMLVK